MPGLCRALEACSYQEIIHLLLMMLSTKSHASFLAYGHGVLAAGAQAPRASSPKPAHQSSLRGPVASPVFSAFLQCDWTRLPRRGESLSPLLESEWAGTHFDD